jgi:hypothetical protein
MSSNTTSQLLTLGITVAVLALIMSRRIRPQIVRPSRIATSAVVITVLLISSLLGTGARLLDDPVALLLIPVFVAMGIGIGVLLVRTMTFWPDPQSGHLWMRGGALFAAILIGSIAIRFGLGMVVSGSPFGGDAASHPSSTVAIAGDPNLAYGLSADLLFLSLGLWGARALLLLQRHRAHLRTTGSELDLGGGN